MTGVGLPAIDHRSRKSRSRTPSLRVVKSRPQSGSKAGGRSRRDTARSAQAARSAFQAFTAIAVLVAALGIGRVWVSVEAAEASMEANQLRRDIKSERYEGDMLEVRQSALGSPSRIRAIAGEALDMAPAKKVAYLDIQDDGARGAGSDHEVVEGQTLSQTPAGAAQGGVMGFVADMMRLSAGEAQVLLVGDVGLTSAK